MLRLTLLLCVVMVGALMILGEDRGQMRPGLAQASADAQATAAPEVAVPAVVEAAPETVVAEPPAETVASVAPAVDPLPEPYVEPARDAVDAPIFTLSSLGNELVPGEAGAADDTAATAAPDPVAPVLPQPGEGTIWYVTADSVNVRSGPSTEAEVVGRLGSGEAAMLVAPADGDWARIVIQGDGVEGYVALRFLSPEAP